MHERRFTISEIATIAGTRVALGMGIGMLLSGRLSRDQRKAAGIALLVVGAATTVPFVMKLIGQSSYDSGDRRKAA
jgi:ABC-type anion transport system duplicated permease subunit